ncbi:MAG: nucleotidyl transferase AbiEii/AbiGii toxin family protein [Candidatus Woesebacteria bacterium]|nr:nucleotidyl transferase AbiEii/AbiGii toxin family protein [Candidatus Woesebacteria bacterium]
MLTTTQVKELSKSLKINDSVVIREYIQLIFLKELYENKYSKNVFFKGGTAIRLVIGGTRFSEDLDFTVSGTVEDFEIFINKFFKKLEKLYEFNIKKRKSITGERYLLTADSKIGNYKVYVNLDFSFREKVLMPNKAIITTNYPVIFTSFVNHLSQEELLAEKIRAVMTREKGRDIYDLWFLLSKNIMIKKDLVKEKLKYYDINKFNFDKLTIRIEKFSKEKFVLDLRPFVPINEREKLANFFDYIISFLRKKLH